MRTPHARTHARNPTRTLTRTQVECLHKGIVVQADIWAPGVLGRAALCSMFAPDEGASAVPGDTSGAECGGSPRPPQNVDPWGAAASTHAESGGGGGTRHPASQQAAAPGHPLVYAAVASQPSQPLDAPCASGGSGASGSGGAHERDGGGGPHERGSGGGEHERVSNGAHERGSCGGEHERGSDGGDTHERGSGGGDTHERGSGGAHERGSGGAHERGSGGAHERGSGGAHERGSGGAHERGSGGAHERGSGGAHERGSGGAHERGSGGAHERGSGGAHERGSGGAHGGGGGEHASAHHIKDGKPTGHFLTVRTASNAMLFRLRVAALGELLAGIDPKEAADVRACLKAAAQVASALVASSGRFTGHAARREASERGDRELPRTTPSVTDMRHFMERAATSVLAPLRPGSASGPVSVSCEGSQSGRQSGSQSQSSGRPGFVLSIPVARGANWFLSGGGRRMNEEEATAAAAERIAAAAEDGTSLPVRLATDVVRFLYGGTGRREPADGGVVSASLLNAKPAVGGIGVEPRGGGVLRVLFTVASDAVADTVVRWRHELRRCVDSTAVFDVLSDREEAQHQALWPAFLAAKVAGKRAQFHRARLVVDGEQVPAPAC
ncbi:hypothetical protein FOA52_004008 [Chlamydomonas sp. UWO 241]|nr:hypothetical protein FOA52_004008 [Chlamydomonas sp. UWO 241]